MEGHHIPKLLIVENVICPFLMPLTRIYSLRDWFKVVATSTSTSHQQVSLRTFAEAHWFVTDREVRRQYRTVAHSFPTSPCRLHGFLISTFHLTLKGNGMQNIVSVVSRVGWGIAERVDGAAGWPLDRAYGFRAAIR